MGSFLSQLEGGIRLVVSEWQLGMCIDGLNLLPPFDLGILLSQSVMGNKITSDKDFIEKAHCRELWVPSEGLGAPHPKGVLREQTTIPVPWPGIGPQWENDS